ncbi:leukotoxin LktA family filamentous adhesin, partial [Endozoicomonas sp. SESOKO1]|uniref:leukotoxin LktA family filamentous adhesin n=1 Tax=Endozoicomonas sp. SESOKO1 TaxID=2828742 RepID=UPI0021488CC6
MAGFGRTQLSVSIGRVNSARACQKSTGASFSSVLRAPAAAGMLLSGTAVAADHDIQAVSDFTSISSNNNVHDITSRKMSGTSAINVFDKFVVGSSHTVNLQVPDSASKLVNIVRGSEAPAVHGIMNSYKNGSLGGDVVFASSAGFLVGESGVVNVGSLAIKTPTDAEISGLISGTDAVDAKITDLLNDSFSVSSSGTVRIKGKINTASGLDINANTIQVDSSGIVISGRAAQASAVALTAVNVDDLTIPTELNVDGGVITLMASSSATGAIDLSGDLYADGGFTIMADNIDVNAGATLDSRDSNSASAAGTIAFKGKTDQTTTTLKLSASGKTVVVESATASSPEQVAEGITVIGNTTVAGSATVTADTFKTRANSSLDLSGSLTVTADSKANVSGTLAAESGITITAKDIDLNAGSTLDTRNSDDSARGDITLTASVTKAIGFGKADSDTNIDLGGQVYARNVTVEAKSIANSSFYEEPGASMGILAAGSFVGASFYLMEAEADATVNVNSSANIQASGNVSLQSEAHALTEASSIVIGEALPASLPAIYASSDATSTTHVKSGATIEAEGNLEVSAHNEAYISASALDIIAEDDNKVVIAAAVAESDVDARAIIDSGVTLDADNLVLAAENQNYYYVSASAYGLTNTQYGIAIAVGDFNTNTTAELGSSLGTDNDKVGNVTITSLNRTLNQRVHSGVTVGSSLLFRTVGSKAVQGLSALQSGVSNYTRQFLKGSGQSVDTDDSGKVSFKGGLSFSLNLSDHDAYSYLGNNVSGQTDAPNINATGNVLLASQVDVGSDNEKMAGGYGAGSLGGDQGGYRTSAETAVTAPEEGSAGAGQSAASDTSLAMALNFAINDSDAVAEVGESTRIKAANLGIVAGQYMPIVSTYDKWDTIADVLGKFNGIGGLQNNLLTTFANAGAAADKEAYGGSLNVVWNDMDTKAWIGDNAEVTTTGTGSWNASRELKANSKVTSLLGDYSVFKDINYSFSFDNSIEVSAYNLMETANLAGNIGSLGILPNGNGTNKQGKAVGASITYVQQSGQAVAGIGKATVTATGDVDIYAETDERHVLVTPSSGMGKGLGFNGVLGFLNSEVLTHASLHNDAQLSAGDLVIVAEHEFGNWAAAGAVNWSDESAVGIAIAANVSQGDTKAFIGDNSSEYDKVKFQDGSNSNTTRPAPTSPTAPAPTKGIIANSVSVRGRSSGTNGSIAVAGALTTEPSNEPGIGQRFENWYNGLSSKVAANYTGANSSNGDSSIGQSADNGGNDDSNANSGQSSAEVSSAQTGLTGAGSFTVSVNNMDAKAIIDGASISGHANGNSYNDVDVEVQALEKVISASASGSAALSMLGTQSPANQNTIAGAIAYQISFNDALAWIKNTTINYADDVVVQALHGGELTSVALAL